MTNTQGAPLAKWSSSRSNNASEAGTLTGSDEFIHIYKSKYWVYISSGKAKGQSNISDKIFLLLRKRFPFNNCCQLLELGHLHFLAHEGNILRFVRTASSTTERAIKAMLRYRALILLFRCQPEGLNISVTFLCLCVCLSLPLSDWIIPLRSQHAPEWDRADGLKAATYPPWQPVINDKWRLALMKPGKGIKNNPP